MVVAPKPPRVRTVDHAAHRARCNHWKGRIDHERGAEGDAFAMQCSILNNLTEFSPVTRAQLEEDVAYDFGSFDMRALHRNIKKLVDLGWIEKGEEFDLKAGWMVPTYRRLRRDDPPNPRRPRRPLPFAPLNESPVGPWPGYLVLAVAPATDRDARDGGWWRRRCCHTLGTMVMRKDAISRAERPPSARSPGSPPPAATSPQPAHPR